MKPEMMGTMKARERCGWQFLITCNLPKHIDKTLEDATCPSFDQAAKSTSAYPLLLFLLFPQY